MKKAVIYARSATENEKDVAHQIEVLRSIAEVQDYTIVKTYVDVKQSGLSTKRPAFTEMNKDMAEWDTIFVCSYDRLYRNAQELFKYMQTLKAAGKEIISFHQTSMSDGIYDFLAELDRYYKGGKK